MTEHAGMSAAKHELLVTPRLLLRPIDKADLADLLPIHSSDEVTEYLPFPSWRSMDDAGAWYQRISARQAEGSAMQYVVRHRESGAAVGTCVLFRLDWANNRAEIGYLLGRQYWGQGIMSEALAALVDYAFFVLDLNRLEADVDPMNAASDRLLRKIGFMHEGLLRERWIMKGKAKDSSVYGLLRREWTARRDAEQ